MRRVASLPDALAGGVRVGPYAQARPGALLLCVPEVARYLVRDGNSIEIAVEPGADPSAVLLYLHGGARGALTHQRGELPLHAATLVPPGADYGVAICGVSGAGKSTLAAELVRRGWSLLADDMTRVTAEAQGIMAWPGDGVIKLWQDACERSGLDVSELPRVREDVDKFFWTVPVLSGPVPLRAIVELSPAGAFSRVDESGAGRLALISENTFRRPHIAALGRMKEHVRIVAQVAGACRVTRLQGTRSIPLAELADRVTATHW